MSKFFNLLLGFFFFPTLILTIFVGLDLPIGMLHTSGENLPYHQEAFLALGLILLVIQLRKSVKRWTGLSLVNKLQKYKWNEPVSGERKRRVIVYLMIEAVMYLVIGAAVYKVAHQAWMPAIAFLFGALDNIAFGLVGAKNKYRLGLTSKALVVVDRDVMVLYFSGLRKVSKQQQTVYFDYIKDLQLSFPEDCIATAKKDEFYATLKDQVNEDQVFFSTKL